MHKTTAVVNDGTPAPRSVGKIAIISAGTADITVAEEAKTVATRMENVS